MFETRTGRRQCTRPPQSKDKRRNSQDKDRAKTMQSQTQRQRQRQRQRQYNDKDKANRCRRGCLEGLGQQELVMTTTRARHSLSSAVHYRNAAATVSFLRDPLLVQLPALASRLIMRVDRERVKTRGLKTVWIQKKDTTADA